MEITVFAKKRTTSEGKTFYSYLSTLKKKDDSTQTVAVKFRDSCGSPKPEECPMNVKVDRQNVNLSQRDFLVEDTGEVGKSFVLWVSDWEKGSPYVDHSLDDYVF